MPKRISSPYHGGGIMANRRRNTARAGTHILEKCGHNLDLIDRFCNSKSSRTEKIVDLEPILKKTRQVIYPTPTITQSCCDLLGRFTATGVDNTLPLPSDLVTTDSKVLTKVTTRCGNGIFKPASSNTFFSDFLIAQ